MDQKGQSKPEPGAADVQLRERVAELEKELLRHIRDNEEIRKTNALFSVILDASSEMFVSYDLEYRIQWASKTASDVVGEQVEDLIGRRCFEVWHRRTAPCPDCPVSRAGEVGVIQEAELSMPDGQVWLLRGCPVKDKGGKVVSLVEFRYDITERKQAEVALRESEERYRRITSAVTDYIFTVYIDQGDIVKTVHGPACIAVTGYSEEEFAADPYLWLNMVLPEDRDRVLEHAARILTRQDAGAIEHRIRRKDGVIRWVLNTPVPQRDSSGTLISYDGLIRDITKRKRVEEEKAKLEALNRQLQKAESLGRMAGAIAHHFNNQLQAVMGNLELAMSDLHSDEASANHLIAAMQAACRATEVSGQMLTYLGQTPGKREPLDFSEVCLRSLPILRAAMPKGMALETHFLSPGPAIRADANQIQQIVTNLVTNAWEAVGEGVGAIRLTVKTVISADIPAENRFPIDWQPEAGSYGCLEVADEGCGIAEKEIEKLFDPFFSSKFTGRGLGLPVVLGIVRAHRGVVTVESRTDRGSVFRVFLPVSPEGRPL